jgi:gas vesicle protein
VQHAWILKNSGCWLLCRRSRIGAAAALLFAPKTGVQTRKDLRRLSKRTMNQLEDLQSEIRDEISERYANVKKMITV